MAVCAHTPFKLTMRQSAASDFSGDSVLAQLQAATLAGSNDMPCVSGAACISIFQGAVTTVTVTVTMFTRSWWALFRFGQRTAAHALVQLPSSSFLHRNTQCYGSPSALSEGLACLWARA